MNDSDTGRTKQLNSGVVLSIHLVGCRREDGYCSGFQCEKRSNSNSSKKNEKDQQQHILSTQQFSALVGVGIFVVVELVEDDSQPVELGQSLDAIGKHGFADHYHLQKASLQTALHSLIVKEERRGKDADKRSIFNRDQL